MIFLMSGLPSSYYFVCQFGDMQDLRNTGKWFYVISKILVVITSITFLIVIFTPPLSGPFCVSGCFEYPYYNTFHRYPRDYYWMYGALLLNGIYLFL